MNELDKATILNEYLDRYNNLPKQRSDEWYKSRRYSIGGSEIATILNKNKYSKLTDLIQTKLGIKKFVSSEPLWFGCLFEDIIKLYCEKVFQSNILEMGGVPYDKCDILKYSPDGLGIVDKQVIKNIIPYLDDMNDPDNEFDEKLLVLFEFKCPFRRVIQQGIVPAYYEPQPQMGLEVINICDVGLYIEAIFRFCKISDVMPMNINNNTYHRYMHFDKVKFNKTLYYGCFSLYIKESKIERFSINSKLEKILKDINTLKSNIKSNNNINDLYYSDNKALNDNMNILFDNKDNSIRYNSLSEFNLDNLYSALMNNIIEFKNIDIIYHDIYEVSNDVNIKYENSAKFNYEILHNKQKIIQNNDTYLGVVCFKIFDSNIKEVYKNNILSNNVLNKIKNVVKFIKEIDNTNNTDTVDIKQKIKSFIKLNDY